MREKINRLARGILDSETPLLSVFPEKLDLPVQSGSVLGFELSVESRNGVFLKGLVYSDSIRVRVRKPSFGGTRCRIAVETDARNAEPGTVISGALTLVTDGGERSIPYHFSVTGTNAGSALDKLENLNTFALIAKADPESALRIFEYRDFASAPFLRDSRLYALYQAFRRGPDRALALEQFLVASGAKKPALVRAETERADLSPGETEGTVRLVLVREGYFRISVSADGAFLMPSRNFVSAQDFQDGTFSFAYSISQAALHEGKNEGRLLFRSEAFSFSIPVSAYRVSSEKTEVSRLRRLDAEKHFAAYLDARVSLEAGAEDAGGLLARMEEELEAAGFSGRERRRNEILLAETFYLGGQTDRLKEVLERAGRKEETPDRQSTAEAGEQLILDALLSALSGDEGRTAESFSGALTAIEEGGLHAFLPVLFLLRPELRRDPETLLPLLRREYASGSRSPFLYAACARLFEEHPECVRTFGPLELMTLRFSFRHGLPGERAAAQYASAAAGLRSFTPLHSAVLSELCRRYPSEQLLTSVCRCLIRSDCRTEGAHAWYLEGVRRGVRLTGLYEYLIYSMSPESGEKLPHEVFLYFAYDNRLDDLSREKLYENLCCFRKKEPELWQEYLKQVEEFALGKLLSGQVNRRLAALYREILCADMVDRKLAEVLPGILNTRRVRVKSDLMRSITVVYPELSSVQTERIESGAAYVPVYTDGAMFLFEDAYGNRYADIPWQAEEVCAILGLLNRCLELDPDGPVPLLERVRKIREDVRREPRALSPDEVRTVRTAMEHLKLSAAFAADLKALLADNADECLDYFLRADAAGFRPAERKKIFSAFFRNGRFNEAYALLSSGLVEDPEPDELAQLCSRIVLSRLFDGDEVLLKLCARVFLDGKADPAVLDYLCEFYNGSSAAMRALLMAAEKAGAETYDLSERLTAQMLFSGEKDGIEEVFARCAEEGKATEVMERAFAADRCGELLRQDRAPDGKLQSALEKMAAAYKKPEEIPAVFRLALLRAYAACGTLTDQQKQLAEELLQTLLDEGLCFPYYKNLAKNVQVPEYLLNCTMVEYRGAPGQKLSLRMRIRPDEEEFRTAALPELFPGIYVYREILFEGETLDYEVLRTPDAGGAERLEKGEAERLETGSAPCGALDTEKTVFDGRHIGSRYGCLNDLSRKWKDRDETALRAEMEAFAAEEDLAAELFRLGGRF